jgi:sialidase-1
MNRSFPSLRSLPPVLLGLALAAAFASRGEGAIERTTLFKAGEGGYSTYRIPALVTTPQRTVLAAAEARRDSGSDWGHIDLIYRRSTDGGRTWEPAQLLVAQADLPGDLRANQAVPKGKDRTSGFTIGNATWVTDAARGRTLFVFCVEYMRCFIMESTDGGATFSKPREITAAFEAFRTRDDYAWRVLATGPGHGAQLSSGRLVVPVWLSTADGSNAHRPSVCGTIYSDDGGKTWQAGSIAAGRNDNVPNPSETAVVEVAPGKVMLSIRNESPRNRRAFVWGSDGATGWSKPEFDEALWEPVCMASILRLPDGALAFSNPASLDPLPNRPNAVNRQRHKLGIRVSRDQGRTWSQPLPLQPGPSAYSDIALAANGDLLCFYEHGDRGPYEAMTVARIPASMLSSSN